MFDNLLLSAGDRAAPLLGQAADAAPPRLLAIALLVTIVGGGLIALFLIGRRTSPGLVIAVSLIIWLVSQLFALPHTRLGNLLAGSTRLLGFAGLLLGIVGEMRKRLGAPSRGPTGPPPPVPDWPPTRSAPQPPAAPKDRP